MDGQEEEMASDKKNEDSQLTETKRVSRNMNEKKRRDRFNLLINELAAVISPGNRNGKFEKVTVLKEAIDCLRSQKTSQSSHPSITQSNWQTSLVGGSELSQLIVEAMNGFVLSLDSSGIITFVSDSILSAVGHRSTEMIDNSIAEFLDQSDRSSIFVHLSLLQREGEAFPPPALNFTSKSKAFGKALAFQMHLLYGPHIDKKGYVTVNCRCQAFAMSHTTSFQPVTLPHGSSQNAKLQLVIVGTLRLPKPNMMVPLADIKAKEFTSKLTLGWKYTQVDPKALLIVGYLPTELIDKSAYLFIHEEDISNITSYHEMLVRKGRVTTCYYRFLTKGQTWVWLRSCCYVSYNQWNSKPEYVTSTTTAVSYEEVCANQENLLKEDKLKFQNVFKKSRNINNSTKTSSSQGITSTSTKPQKFSQEQNSKNLPCSNSLGNSKLDTDRSKTAENLPEIDILKPNIVARMQSKELVAEPIDEDLSMDIESIASESSDLSLSTMKAPEGLTPAQSKLHVQLRGKHRLLEKSIKHQIDELERIKKQIEINKQLWEFNKQLQEKKSGEIDKGVEGLLTSPAKRGLESEGLSGMDNINESVKRSLVQTSSMPYCPVEIPVSYYVDIPPINLGNPPDFCDMEQMDPSAMDTNAFTPFSNSMPSNSTQASYSYFPFQPQGR
ncbi:circadian locomoter output cycles protein kaput-like [Actinia tenebrosa]|uniref:Circadian locomoter output cycles protein kaput-like n=1 Tax=Actinia tenebrosa TaxID=6105 RepID=A0A6P8J9M9_ACTTE|nr:circadian locomoter output cycles protein kaput-like [Actinia tenebrosa]